MIPRTAVGFPFWLVTPSYRFSTKQHLTYVLEFKPIESHCPIGMTSANTALGLGNFVTPTCATSTAVRLHSARGGSDFSDAIGRDLLILLAVL